jgi:hypothetical protein
MSENLAKVDYDSDCIFVRNTKVWDEQVAGASNGSGSLSKRANRRKQAMPATEDDVAMQAVVVPAEVADMPPDLAAQAAVVPAVVAETSPNAVADMPPDLAEPLSEPVVTEKIRKRLRQEDSSSEEDEAEADGMDEDDAEAEEKDEDDADADFEPDDNADEEDEMEDGEDEDEEGVDDEESPEDDAEVAAEKLARREKKTARLLAWEKHVEYHNAQQVTKDEAKADLAQRRQAAVDKAFVALNVLFRVQDKQKAAAVKQEAKSCKLRESEDAKKNAALVNQIVEEQKLERKDKRRNKKEIQQRRNALRAKLDPDQLNFVVTAHARSKEREQRRRDIHEDAGCGVRARRVPTVARSLAVAGPPESAAVHNVDVTVFSKLFGV